MIAASEFMALVDAVRAGGFGADIEWSESAAEPRDSDEFAREAIFVICNSGMRFTVAEGIFRRVMAALDVGKSASSAFGHKGKAAAIDEIWRRRFILLSHYRAAADKVAFCETLPWIGGITKYHLAKNFGAQVAKPDVHLQRLAEHEGTTPQALCERLAGETGLKVATVDVVLWRACATGLLKSRALS